MDPDVLAALDDDFNFEDPENELEDNFMELATGGDVHISEESEDRKPGAIGKRKDIFGSDDGEYMDEDEDKVGELMYTDESSEEDGEDTRFTNYSMSSSVLRRNEQLTLLDDRFEKVSFAILSVRVFGIGDNHFKILSLRCSRIMMILKLVPSIAMKLKGIWIRSHSY